MKLKKFKLPNGKIIEIEFFENKKKKFVARIPYIWFLNIGRIKVDELFFKFPYREQVPIIYHELWHYKNNIKFEFKTLFKKPWLIFFPKSIYFAQEFEADSYASKMTNEKDTAAMLFRLEKMVDKDLIKGHEKTHPPIMERIKWINKNFINRLVDKKVRCSYEKKQ